MAMDCVKILMVVQEKGHTYGFCTYYKTLTALEGACQYCMYYMLLWSQ